MENTKETKQYEPCFICGSQNWKKLSDARDLLHEIEGHFWLMECQECSVVVTHPQLSAQELEKYYPTDYIAFPRAIEEESSWLKRADRQRGVRRHCNFAIKESGKEIGSVLDVGCATGIFLKGMQDRGWQATGVEPSDFAQNYATEKLKLNVLHGYLEPDTFEANQFDLVTLWDVFEHLPDPVETLHTLHKILKPGGVLLLNLPNSNSWDRRMFKSAWSGWDTPRHTYIYNEPCLTRLLEKHGFRFKRIKSFTGHHGAFALSLAFWLKNKKVSEKKQKAIMRFFYSIFCRALTYPYFMFTNAINKSAGMAVTYIKE